MPLATSKRWSAASRPEQEPDPLELGRAEVLPRAVCGLHGAGRAASAATP
jgi:hypothetical protein